MKLYLAQHGDATAKEENPDRPLSDSGNKDVEVVGRLLHRAGVSVSHRVEGSVLVDSVPAAAAIFWLQQALVGA